MIRLRRRPRNRARDLAAEDLRQRAEIALFLAANGQPITKRLGRLTTNRIAELASERGCELRFDIRPIKDPR